MSTLGAKSLLLILRLALPSWRFFEEPGPLPVLWHRTGPSDDELGQWKMTLAAPPRHLSQFFLNPEGNLYLCHQTHVERLFAESQAWTSENIEDLAETVSYKLVLSIVENSVLPEIAPMTQSMQFRITIAGEEAFISHPHSVVRTASVGR